MDFLHQDYTVVREIGQGASATVYLAIQNQLNRKVALKVLHEAADAGLMRQRFKREALILAQLTHTNIVPIYELIEEAGGGRLGVAMQYVDGGTLSNFKSTLTVAECLDIIIQITTALEHAHRHGFLHRDIKPDNILFNKHMAMLADFGIARQEFSKTNLTATGTLLGTPDYMSPEQISEDSVDARSDLYSLGIVFYELLAGVRPYVAETALATGILHVTGTPASLPAALSSFQPCIDSLLAKNKNNRIQSAKLLLDELDRLKRDPQLPLESPLTELRTAQMTAQSLSGVSGAERRQLTVMHCELAEFSTFMVQNDPEDSRDVLHSFHASVESTVQKFDGHIAQYRNDSLVIYFGYPTAHEDDAQRAVNASISINKLLEEQSRQLKAQSISFDLRARIGIHTGTVIIGGTDDPQKDKLATGQTPDIAATLQRQAEIGSTLISEFTSRLLDGTIEFESIEHPDQNPAIENQRVYSVKGEAPSQNRFRATHSGRLPILRGREEEKALLTSLWQEATTAVRRVSVSHVWSVTFWKTPP